MSDAWYEQVAPDTRLSQGDIILDCPLLRWKAESSLEAVSYGDGERIRTAIETIRADTIVMTQACDLEQEKVRNVVLCSHRSLSEYRLAWEETERRRGQTPTDKSWSRFRENVKNGYIWNLSLINEGQCESLSTEVRVVDFHEIYTVPRSILENLLQQRMQPRLRLRPPYREHLSQAFARYFMRVGLPIPITFETPS